MRPKFDPAIHSEDAPLTEEFMQGMRPAREIHGDDWVAAKMGRKRGRPKLETPKVEVKIRLDAATVEYLRHSGPGWQTRVNALLGRLVEAGQI